MKRLLIYMGIIFSFTNLSAQGLVGVGTGYDWFQGYHRYTPYVNRDIAISVSHSRNKLRIEAIQSFRFLGSVETLRSNTYLLFGLTTPREKLVIFNMVAGGALSLTNQSKTSTFPNQFCPTLKGGFDFRIGPPNKIYLGIDCLFTSYVYLEKDKWGYSHRMRYITGSVLVSLKYFLKRKS